MTSFREILGESWTLKSYKVKLLKFKTFKFFEIIETQEERVNKSLKAPKLKLDWSNLFWTGQKLFGLHYE